MKNSTDSGSSNIVAASFRFKLTVATAGFGLTAGLIATLAISAIILLAERLTSLPLGTFYFVLSSAIFQTQDQVVFSFIELGFFMHILAGALIGLAISLLLFLIYQEKHCKNVHQMSRSTRRFMALQQAL